MTFFKDKKRLPFYIFSVLITAFFLFFSKVIVKSDDGHFIGILNETGFNLFEWLKYRYESISGRTVCEFLTMVFFSVNPVFNQLFFSLLWIVFIALLLKASTACGQDTTEEKIFGCSVPFSVLLTCLNSGAVWFSGGFTYFVPFVFMVIALSPLVFELLGTDYKKPVLIPASAVCAYMACSQEQAAALTVTFLAVLLVWLICRRKAKLYHFLPLIASAVETFFLFSAPGMRKRVITEAASFERFSSMNPAEKIVCGFSNYLAFQFFTSLFVSGLFVFLLCVTLKRLYGKKNRLYRWTAALWGTVCIGLNAAYIGLNRTVPDKGFEAAFKSGALKPADKALLLAGLIWLLCLLAAIIRICVKEFKTGFAVLLCFCAGVCSGVMLGFSSSVYASGQRVFFFSELLLLIACVILFVKTENRKLKKKLSNCVFLFSLTMYLSDCLFFAFMETPFMG